MPRRRMLDPDFWTDPGIRTLSLAERLLFLGCMSMADDDGRLLGSTEYLKGQLFAYDPKITTRKVKKWRDNIAKNLKNFCLYQDAGVEYIQFLKWGYYEKPSHARPSKLPPPPQFSEAGQLQKFQESITEPFTEPFTESSKESITESFPPRSGQSSQGKDSLRKSSLVNHHSFNFKYKTNTDLTDYLTTLLKENIPRGAAWGAEVITQFWEQCIGKPDSMVFQGALVAVKSYSPEIIAQALIKAKSYGAGKHHTWKYAAEILKELTSKGSNDD